MRVQRNRRESGDSCERPAMLIRNRSVLIGFLENQSESLILNSFSQKDFQECSIGDHRSRRPITNGPFVIGFLEKSLVMSLADDFSRNLLRIGGFLISFAEISLSNREN